MFQLIKNGTREVSNGNWTTEKRRFNETENGASKNNNSTKGIGSGVGGLKDGK